MNNIGEEIDNIETFSDYELIEYLQNGLISRATGGVLMKKSMSI